MADETMFDVPVTPAPVFAYRALRGIFFGSPDSSPVLPDAKTTPASDDMRVPVYHRSPNAKSRQRDARSPVKLTPAQKRKRAGDNLLSPTKSCLKTPGTLTPRHALLRDVNVSFKETNPGPRPDVARFGFRNHSATLSGKENIAPSQKLSALLDRHSGSARQPQPSHGASSLPAPPRTNFLSGIPDAATSSDFDLATYLQNTEREMKKLIRYSQKMRDYARKHDEENAKLRRLVEDLQAENAILKDLSPSTVPVTTHEAVVNHEVDRPRERKGESRTSKSHQRGVLREELFATRSSAQLISSDHHADRKANIDTQTTTAAGLSRSSKSNSEIDKAQLGPNQNLSQHTRDPSPLLNSQPGPARIQKASLDKTQRSSAHGLGLLLDPNLPLRPASAAPSSSVHMAPNRLAAARARLREKRDARKASTSTNGDVEPHVKPKAEAITDTNHQICGTSLRQSHHHTSHAITSAAATTTTTQKKHRDKHKSPEESVNASASIVDWAGL